jgi:hypothetical protein
MSELGRAPLNPSKINKKTSMSKTFVVKSVVISPRIKYLPVIS